MKIRKAVPEDAAAIAFVNTTSWKTTYKGIVSDTYLTNLQPNTKRWEELLDQKIIVYVAEDADGNIVGFASGGPDRTQDYPDYGEIYAIYLLEEYQGKGSGSRLMAKVMNELQLLGMSSILVWALKDNTYRQFYEKIGGQLVDGEKTFEIGGESLVEVAYKWTLESF